MAHKVRLFVDHPLAEGQTVPLDRDQSHYLFGVMRLEQADLLLAFNGVEGEWEAEVAKVSNKSGVLICRNQTGPLQFPPDIWLVFAPVKKERTAFIVEKATELGVAKMLPIQSAFTNHADRLRVDKLRLTAREAAEQCGGTFVPEISDAEKLGKVLDHWDEDRTILFCDESLVGAANAISGQSGKKYAIFIGPEGGFSDAERTRLRAMKCTLPISLGPRILRAETAAIAALTLWQQQLGDW